MQSPAIATFALLLGGALLAACGQSGDPASPQHAMAQSPASGPPTAPTDPPTDPIGPTDPADITDVTDWTDSAEAAAQWNDETEKGDVRADALARNEAEIAAGEQRLAEIDERLRQLDAAERASNAVAVKLRGPEPSEADMRAALEYAMYASNGETRIDNGVARSVLSIKQFQKQGCMPAEAADGYYCEYLIEAAMELQANDGGGVDWNDFLDAMLVPENASGRFVYDTSLQRWVRFDP